jgi:hypothetical protein
MRRLLLVLSLLSTSLFITSCGGDDTAAPGPEPGPGVAASKRIPPTGGSIAVASEGGAVLAVSFPAGAVLEPTDVSLRAVATPAGMRARFLIEPSGLDLLAPATFTVTLPEGASVAGNLGISFERSERVHVPTDVDAGARTLRCALPHLGFGDLAAVVGAAPGSRATTAEAEEFINVEAFECQLLEESLTDAILRAQAFVGAFPPDLASPLIQQYRAALLACGPDSLAGQQAAMQALACDKADGATLNAQVVLVETAQALKQSLGFLMAAEGMVQLVDAGCGIETSLLETEFDEFLQSYLARINDPGFVASFPTWDALWREMVTCLEVAAMAQEFGVPQAEATIYNELFPALFTRLREVAADACAQDENNSFYLDILTGGHALNHAVTPVPEMPQFTGFQQSEIVDEMHRCGATVIVEARTQQDDPLDSATIQGGSGSVRVIDQGKLVLTSDILNFTCGSIVARPPLRVRAEIPGHLPVVSLGTLSGPLTLQVASIVSSLPRPGGDPPREFDVVIERDRSVCDIDAPGTIELCRIAVDTHGFEGGMTGTWSGGCQGGGASGTFQISVARDGTVTGTYDGDAAGDITGTVTPDGTFDATASGGATGGCTWTGTLSIAGGSLSGSGSWECGNGQCSGGWSGP